MVHTSSQTSWHRRIYTAAFHQGRNQKLTGNRWDAMNSLWCSGLGRCRSSMLIKQNFLVLSQIHHWRCKTLVISYLVSVRSRRQLIVRADLAGNSFYTGALFFGTVGPLLTWTGASAPTVKIWSYNRKLSLCFPEQLGGSLRLESIQRRSIGSKHIQTIVNYTGSAVRPALT